MDFVEVNAYRTALILSLLFGEVYTQVSLSLEKQGPFQCDGKLRLICTFTGSGECCPGSKFWRADGLSLTIGTDDDSKYVQETFNGTFNLIINQLEVSDFDKEYTCRYQFKTSSPFKPSGDFYCNRCGGFGFLWVLIGVIVAFLVCILIVKLKEVRLTAEKLIVTSVVSIIISLVVSGAVAIPVCIVYRLCQASPRLDPLFILLGTAVEAVSFFLVALCFVKLGSKKEENSSTTKKPPAT